MKKLVRKKGMNVYEQPYAVKTQEESMIKSSRMKCRKMEIVKTIKLCLIDEKLREKIWF